MRTTLIIALLGMCSTAVAAPGAPERGQVDWSLGLTYNFATSSSSSNGSSIDFDDRMGWMFGVDYFVTDKLAIGFDMAFARPDYTAVLVPQDGSPDVEIRHQASMFTGQLNGTFVFTDKVVSPFVEAGLGWTNFDSNVADGPPITGCWWDPIWGTICSSWYSTYSESTFSYGAGLGLRWNLGYDISVKATYRWLEIDSGNTSNRPSQDSAMLEVVWHF